MRKPITILLGCMLMFCGTRAQVKLTARFNSFPLSDYRIVYGQSMLNNYQGQELASGKTNAAGELELSAQPGSEQPVMLFIGMQFLRLWMPVTGAMNIQETGNTLSFSGSAAVENEFLYRSGLMQPMHTPATIAGNAFEPAKQGRYLDSIEQRRWAIYKQAIRPQQVSARFTSYCAGEISHFTFFQKSQYPLRFIYMDKTLKEEDVPPGYFTFWDQFRLLEDSCSSDMYFNSLQDYIAFLAKKQGAAENDVASYQLKFRISDSLLAARPLTRQKQQAEMLLFLLKYFDYGAFTGQKVQGFRQEFAGSPYSDLLEKEWAKKNKISLSAPAFQLNDMYGKPVSIADFKGKIVYVDFWGSWCIPCMAQMPHSARLQEMFKGRDVVFLFINFYDTRQKWLAAIKKEKLKGIHVKAEAEHEDYFNEAFGIKNGFPRYALINRKGLLVTTAAPHPGDEGAAAFLEKHLAED
jgi:thiol-disulfide isomerase/thioredoxin